MQYNQVLIVSNRIVLVPFVPLFSFILLPKTFYRSVLAIPHPLLTHCFQSPPSPLQSYLPHSHLPNDILTPLISNPHLMHPPRLYINPRPFPKSLFSRLCIFRIRECQTPATDQVRRETGVRVRRVVCIAEFSIERLVLRIYRGVKWEMGAIYEPSDQV